MTFIRPHQAGFLLSVIHAILSVVSVIVPYFAVARIVNLLIDGEMNFFTYLTWGIIALIAYLMPFGYATVIGEGGATISRGARQRISIARAMLKNAHRLETVRNADQILVADPGQIVQYGTHEQLVEQLVICTGFRLKSKTAINWKINT